MTTKKMVSELKALRAVAEIHRAKIEAAAEHMESLAEIFETWFGFHPSEVPEHAPGWTAARAAYDALREESGYYWLCSRISDLETITESGRLVAVPGCFEWSCAHVFGIGDMPKAHPSVAAFVAETLGLSEGVKSAA